MKRENKNIKLIQWEKLKLNFYIILTKSNYLPCEIICVSSDLMMPSHINQYVIRCILLTFSLLFNIGYYFLLIE